MRRVFLLLIISLLSLPAGASECSKYLTDLYSQECDTQVKIVSKDEHIDSYQQKIGEAYVSSIAYGTGYLKKKKCRKIRVTYICLLDENCKPFWGYIVPR